MCKIKPAVTGKKTKHFSFNNNQENSTMFMLLNDKKTKTLIIFDKKWLIHIFNIKSNNRLLKHPSTTQK